MLMKVCKEVVCCKIIEKVSIVSKSFFSCLQLKSNFKKKICCTLDTGYGGMLPEKILRCLIHSGAFRCLF